MAGSCRPGTRGRTVPGVGEKGKCAPPSELRLTAPSSLQPTVSQDCSGQCQCAAAPAPRCPAGVSLVLDGCGCCRVCAKQLGELCTERDPCDPHKGLFCDFGSPANRKIGVCTGKTLVPMSGHLLPHVHFICWDYKHPRLDFPFCSCLQSSPTCSWILTLILDLLVVTNPAMGT